MSSCKSQYYACSRGTKQPWRRAITMRSAESELQNTIELRATASEIAAPKPDLGAKAKQNHNFEAFFTRNFKMKIPAPKLIKSADKSLSQPWCSHSNTIYDVQLQKTLVLRMQLRHQATLMQPLQCVWQHHVANSHVATHMATEHDNNHAAIIMQSATRHSTSALNDAHMNNHSLQNTKGEPIRPRNDRSRTRRTQEVPFIAAWPAATLHGKTPGFVLQLPPQHKSHATSCNIHAAITMRFAATPTHPCSHYATICIRSLYSLQHRGGTNSTPKWPPHPPHTGGTFHRRLQPLYTEKRQVSCSSFLPNTGLVQHSCSHYNAYCSNTYTSMQPLHHDLHPLVAEHRGGTDSQRRYLSSPPAATLHGQTQGFVAPVPPQHKFHATFMQPLQCVLQQHLHIHAAITVRFASRRCRTQRRNRFDPETTAAAFAAHRRYLSSPPAATLHGKTPGFLLQLPPQHKSHATSCNIHAAITMRFAATPTQPCSHYTTICIRSLYSLQHRGRTDSTPKRPPHPPHTGGTFHRCLQPLYTEKHQVSCSGFLPNTSLMQHSCSHYNAFCCSTYTSMQPLHHDLHSLVILVAEHRGGTDSTLRRPQPHPPHTRGTFHRRLQPLYTEKRQVSCSNFLPNTNPMQHSCSHYNAFCSNTYTPMQPLHYD